MYGYIYITTNLINNKKYIGQHKSEVFTEDYKGSGKLLIKAIEKYGIDNFKVELLEECDSLEELNEREKYWIRYYDAVDSNMFYNLIKGGEGGSVKGRKLSESTKNKISISINKVKKSGINHPMYGRRMKRGEETVNKLRNSQIGSNNSFYGKHHSKETIELYKKQRSGENNPMYGKRQSDDGRKRISESKRGKIFVNNGIISKLIDVKDLEYYKLNGFVRGRKK